jgi:peptide/nickel transport system substrate-binding protein
VRKKQFRKTVVAVLAGTMMLASLGSVGVATSAASAATSSAASKPRSGGSLTFLHSREVTSLDVTASTGATNVQIGDSQQFQAIYDVLMYEDASGKVENRIAESITPNADASVWTLKLRKGVNFSDGTPYDAAAVKFNWTRLADPANRSPQAGSLANIKAMDVTDPLTLKITLTSPYGQFPRQIARSFPFVGSPTAIQKEGAGFGTAPVGAGPFTVKEWVRNSSLTLEKNPNYWDSPRPYLDELIIKQVPDADQRYNTFVSGDADIMGVGTEYQLATKANAAGLRKVSDVAPYGGAYLSLNMRRAPFNDVLARKALAYALNRQGLVDTLYSGVVSYPKTLFPTDSPYYAKGTKLVDYDAKKAQKALDDYKAKYGKPLSFTITGLSPSQLPEVQYMQTQLGGFKNIEVKAESDVAANFPARLSGGDYDAMVAAISGYDPEPDFYNHLHTGGIRNYMAYSNPQMDAALDKGRVETDVKARAKAYKTVQQLVEKDVPEIFWRQQLAQFELQPNVEGAKLTPCCFIWGDVWLKK